MLSASDMPGRARQTIKLRAGSKSPPSELAGLGGLFVLQGEANLQRHLIVVHAIICDMPANLLDFEPA
jgi:hypothetical protein